MWRWSNEYEVPAELLGALKVQNLPAKLRKCISLAVLEVAKYGVVTHRTKVQVEIFVHQHLDSMKKFGIDGDTA